MKAYTLNSLSFSRQVFLFLCIVVGIAMLVVADSCKDEQGRPLRKEGQRCKKKGESDNCCKEDNLSCQPRPKGNSHNIQYRCQKNEKYSVDTLENQCSPEGMTSSNNCSVVPCCNNSRTCITIYTDGAPQFECV